MSKYWWLIAVPKTGDAFGSLKTRLSKEMEACAAEKFNIPDLRVGTLDSLLAMSDELSKVDSQVEQITAKIASQLMELVEKKPGKQDNLNVGGTSLEQHLIRWSWDDARFNARDPIRDIVTRIKQHTAKLDEELRAKASEYNSISQLMAAEERKKSGNLMQRSLLGVIPPNEFVESESLTSLFVVIPRLLMKDFMNQYETLCEFVVPRSATVITDDREHILYRVVIFKRKVEEFKIKAREARFFVREVTKEDLDPKSNDGQSRKLESDMDQIRSNLLRWCKINFSEAFTHWVHLKAIRVFVEAVLRFGLPANFQAILILPQKKEDPRLRKLLMDQYKDLGKGQFNLSGKEVEIDVPAAGNDREFFPYVYTSIDLALAK